LLIVNKALRLEGFLTSDFMPEWGDALDQLAGWTQQGQLKTITRSGTVSMPHPQPSSRCWPGKTSDRSWSVLVPTPPDAEPTMSIHRHKILEPARQVSVSPAVSADANAVKRSAPSTTTDSNMQSDR
jgi:hypothetical protein